MTTQKAERAHGAARVAELEAENAALRARLARGSSGAEAGAEPDGEALDRRLLAEAVHQAAEAVVITDREGLIEYTNPAFERISGYSRMDTVGKTPRILKSGVQDSRFYEVLWQTVLAGRVWEGRMVNRRKDGAAYTEETTIAPVRGLGGVIEHFVAVKRDVSHEQELEAEVVAAQRMEAVGRLAGGIAHDFNNLLSVIVSCAALALEERLPPGEIREDLEEIAAAANRAATLTRQLLAFGRRQVLEPRVVDLNAVVSDMERMLERILGEDIDLRTLLSPDLGRVEVDPGQIEQVILNLAVNARDAMPGGGRLTLETSDRELGEDYAARHAGVEPGAYAMLAVSDTGCGMDRETAGQVFEPFFTTKERGKGTGLGLSTSYGIVKQSGGNIWVYSEPGLGTTFKIYLPHCERGGPGYRSMVPRPSQPGAGETVLVVEDDPPVRRLAVRVLKSRGYHVLEASGHADALRAVREPGAALDLLVTDVVMPGGSGKRVCDDIRALLGDLPVLFMSGYTDDTIAHHGVLDPGVALLQKPFTPESLARRVRDLLDERRASRPGEPAETR